MVESTPLRRGDKRERTKAALIAAALEVARTQGFAAASLDEIARRAGMTKGAIYSNFGDKAELMLAAASSASLRLRPKYTPGAPITAQLRAAGEALADALPQAGELAWMHADFNAYVAGEPNLRAKVGAVYLAGFHQMAEALEAAYGDQLRIPARDVVLAAQALSLGFAQQHLLTPELVTREAILTAFEALARGVTREG